MKTTFGVFIISVALVSIGAAIVYHAQTAPRYAMSCAVGGNGGIVVRTDLQTGKTWRWFCSSNTQWEEIKEPKKGRLVRIDTKIEVSEDPKVVDPFAAAARMVDPFAAEKAVKD